MFETAAVLLALALAGALAWLFKLKGERDLAHQRLVDLQRDEARMRDSFQSLANDTLRKQSEQLLILADQKFAARDAAATAELDKRKQAVDQLVAPIGKALEKTQAELQAIEKARTESYAGLRTQVQAMTQQNEQLRAETGKLAQALSSPTVRGRYGEVQLQRVAELAGMQAYCDFAVQESVRDGEGRLLKPDMVVRMPSDRVVAIDAKTNISAYLEAIDSKSNEQAEACLVRYADHVADQVQALGKKGYWKHFDSPEFVVMFVPGDQFLEAALRRRPDLIDLAARSNVIVASPSTLIGVLRAVQVGWREKKLAESAQELFKLGRELHERFRKALEHADRLHTSLSQSVDRYNDLVGSIDARVFPTLRKFEESGASTGEPIDELTPVEAKLRKLASSPNARALSEPKSDS